MPKRLRKCLTCKQYTLSETCNKCKNPTPTRFAHPPRFSIQDKYGRFRRQFRKDIQQ